MAAKQPKSAVPSSLGPVSSQSYAKTAIYRDGNSNRVSRMQSIATDGSETAQECCTKQSWPCFQPIMRKNSNLSRWKLKQSVQNGVRTFVHPSPCWKTQKTATLRDRMSAIGLLVQLQASSLLLEPRRLVDQLSSRAPAASPHSHSQLALQELIKEEL